ncbi:MULTISPECIES: efflux RND transporter periplasmic adaptor subunit [unclassified Mesorhizobium]|uniref:efflux RND transporter periplasmic adaptor subunit n=1 Tax=unclassified Mesorhizobium TaxID=325217 RepID=UPI000FD5B903|nr:MULTISPECIES: efflux RND transporter periplasmic adaptor subunit [unclassified Mesorhizobium]RUW95820.1 efflux RND transporter periplasmic adaptor subunit [Mesorhizobium sp. M8A.F.Ca.ET.023.01.1.1]RWC72967.1 MAG: efflux RND transporter periplasmic adaptor subunit [Mesorhizobium sp.]TGQ77927.1 efflux RND transporter periplasmic adaptor subunit [Mesorhizobium sp. M8A.F.Ca.ET.207.01.1.1]TGT88497.1 efflux RND transporter periplasmic adaptor subunit [Mesorhizobium sp. M8A.F.Ca.ET.161.01.1.1]TGV4
MFKRILRIFLIIVVLAVLVIVVGGIVGFNFLRDNGIKQYFATMKPPAATVSTTIAKPSNWTPGVEAIGTVSAVRGVDLTVETAGIVKEILFHANQKVADGAVLLQLDDAVERADLEATKAQVALVETALTRAVELQKRGVNAEATLDTARATASATAAQVNKLQAVLDQKQLRAPFSGTVGIPKIDLGQYLATGTSVVTLQDLDTMRVDFSVPEQQLPLLQIGQTVRLGQGGGDMPFAGKIRGIDPKIDPSSRLVNIRAEVANPEGRLTPGQFVQVRVELPEEQDVLSLPQTALTTSLYGDYIFVVQPAKPAGAAPAQPAKPEEKPAAAATDKPADAKPADKAASDAAKPADPAKPAAEADKPALVLSQVFVKPGRRNQGMVEIVEGLKAGDEVVTAGQNRLFNGMSVNVDNTIDPTKSANKQADQQ